MSNKEHWQTRNSLESLRSTRACRPFRLIDRTFPPKKPFPPSSVRCAVEVRDLNVLGLVMRLMAGAKHIWSTLYQGVSPSVYLTRVYVEPAGQMGNRFFAQECSQGHLGLGSWAVVLPCLFIVLLLYFCNSRSGTLS
jgi:hypothetical protein